MARLTPKLLRELWLIAAVLWVGVWLYPPSTILTRTLGAALAIGLWVGLIGLLWRHRALRLTLPALTLLGSLSLLLPARTDAKALRAAFVTALLRYRGVTYFWGGESPRGIDCSGLIRRGLIDSLLWRGVRTADPGLVRHALWVWWNDCSARDLGEGTHGFTAHCFDTPSLNALDHAQLAPGDLAVTASGVHIMAFVGGHDWIEADPGVAKVITLTAPADNGWLTSPMKITRWKILEEPPVSAR